MNKKIINNKKAIPLSPNEEKTFRENEERKKRILRIQQVHNQGKKISEKRTSTYNASVEEELKNLIQLIQNGWNKTYERKADNFFKLKKLIKNYIGAAQANAKIQLYDEKFKNEEILRKLYEERIKENERYVEARNKQCQESMEKIKNITDYIKNHYNAVTTSNSREKRLINQYREKQRNRKLIDGDNTFMTFKDERDLQKKNYNNTSYHRDHNVIRCDHQRNNIYNASEIAYQKSREGQMNIENNKKKLKESLKITKDRYNKAITKINDEKQKELFIKNLKTLETIDILRKKENIKNSLKDYEEQKIFNNINLDLADANKKNYCINYYTNKELKKIPKELEKSNKREWKNVGMISYGNTSRPYQRNNSKESNNKSIKLSKKYDKSFKSNDYSVCDNNSIVNQDVIRKVLLHQYP